MHCSWGWKGQQQPEEGILLFSHTQLILWQALLGGNFLRLHQKQRGCRTQYSKREPSTEPLRTQPPQGMRAASWLMPDLSTNTHSPQKQAPHPHQCLSSPWVNPLCRSQEAAPRHLHLSASLSTAATAQTTPCACTCTRTGRIPKKSGKPIPSLTPRGI